MVTAYKKIPVAGINVFYREAGPRDAPAVVLLHGFPSSSHMFRDLIRDLSDRFHLIAPDYPGFGNSDCPDPREFAYTFDHLSQIAEEFLETLGVTRFSLYMQDYGGPIGFRIASRHPEWIESLIVQNANAYTEGLSEAWAPLRALWQSRQANEQAVRNFLLRETTVFQYAHGANNAELISPDAYESDQSFLDRPGNDAIQLELFFDYQANLRLYPEWQAYMRKHQPRTLIVWGKNDPFFTVAGAEAFKKDLDSPEIHLIDTGHFALEEAHEKIAALIGAFISQPHTNNAEVVWGIARVVAAPGREAELRSALDTVVAATRKEPGNLSFDLYRAAGDPTFFIQESWRSQEDLERHFSTPHVSTFKVSLAALALGPLELTQLKPLVNHQLGKGMNMSKLQGKIAVVTGGNSGIGLATAQALRQLGAQVAISGRDKKTLEQASKSLGGAFAAQADVTDLNQIEQFYSQVAERLGKIDILFLNAGVAKFAPVGDTTETLYDELFDINVKGVFFSAQKALPYLNDNASIILNTSIVNSVGWPGTSVYSAAKAAVRSLARTFSADLLPRGIRVNAVSPGPIATPIFSRMGLPKDATDALAQSILEQVPMKRFGDPAEVASAVAFFASPDSSYVTAAELRVGGGIGEL